MLLKPYGVNAIFEVIEIQEVRARALRAPGDTPMKSWSKIRSEMPLKSQAHLNAQLKEILASIARSVRK
jgi:hypothetical protein